MKVLSQNTTQNCSVLMYYYNDWYQFIYGYALFCPCMIAGHALSLCCVSFCCFIISTPVNRTGQLAMRLGSAMASVGQLTEFNHETESTEAHIKRLKLYLLANQIEKAMHAAVLLSVIRASNYSLLCNLISPASPKDKSFADLVAVLKDHFAPKPLTIAERFKFHRRYQKEGETVTEYMVELRHLSKYCEFGRTNHEAFDCRFREATWYN